MGYRNRQWALYTWARERMSSTEQTVLMALADLAPDDTRTVSPTNGRIQEMLSVAHTSVTRALKRLADSEIIHRADSNQRGGRSVWFLPIPEEFDPHGAWQQQMRATYRTPTAAEVAQDMAAVAQRMAADAVSQERDLTEREAYEKYMRESMAKRDGYTEGETYDHA